MGLLDLPESPQQQRGVAEVYVWGSGHSSSIMFYYYPGGGSSSGIATLSSSFWASWDIASGIAELHHFGLCRKIASGVAERR